MILCCGEALIDMLPRETAGGEPAFAPHAGGAMLNTAVALGRLGAPAGYFGGLSTDLFGRQLAETLDASGVDHTLCPRVSRPTTLAFVTLVDGQAAYAFHDENTAGRMLDPDALPELPEAVGALLFGGISLAAEPCGAAYEALMAREAGARVTMLDPNIRPAFIEDAASYRRRLDRMIARADIVKVSDEDLAWLMGGDEEDAARALLDRGPALVVVTSGAQGATAYRGRARVFRAARPVTVSDTVGAGDTVNAGLLAALDRAGALTRHRLGALEAGRIGDALDLGMRAAAVTVSRAGANPPWAHEL